MASPAARVLNSKSSNNAPGPVFALFGRVGRSPRIYCGLEAGMLLQMMQATALKKLGMQLTGADPIQCQNYLILMLCKICNLQ